MPPSKILSSTNTTRKNPSKIDSLSDEEDMPPSKILSSTNTTRKNPSIIDSVSDDEELLKKIDEFKKKRSSKLINSKLREHPKLLLSYNLSKICKYSGYCIAFGKKTELIKKLFENFNNPEFIKYITTLSSGINGEVLKVLFERYKYKVWTILKIMKNDGKNPDNLIYEYIVGKFLINKYYKRFPCFLETYGFIFNDQIKDIKYNKKFFNIQNIEIPEIKKWLKYGCTSEKYFGLVIEYVKNPKTLYENLIRPIFWYKNLLIVLFQIYYTLFLLKDVFTHYDLHMKNVLIFEPKKKHYIQYHYHYRGEVISFKSNYIVKIIDYGRCGFVNNEDHITSNDIYNDLCNIRECNQTNASPCGARKGFYISIPDSNNHYITPRKLNNSSDLRLLKSISNYFIKHVNQLKKYTIQFTEKDRENIYLLFKKIKFIDKYGTQEDKTSGLTESLDTPSINNITDAFFILKKLLQLPYVITQNNDFYNDKTKIGDLNIYDDGRDMEFNEI